MSGARPLTLRIGIAGLGVGAMNMIPELHAHPKATIAAAADLRPQALDRFRADFGGPTFPSVEEMCAKAGIDVVYVMTPDPLHAEHAIVAAEHGKHVMLDKPMGLTLEECDRVIEAAGRNNVHVLVGHTQSLDPPILKMAQIANSGRLGKPVMLHTMLYSDWVYRPRTPEELMQDRGGSIVRRQGPIQVDILRMIGGGMVRSVRATANAADPARPIDGSYTAFLAFEDGHAATMVYDGYAHFDSSELTHGFTMGGMPFDPGMHTATRARSAGFADAAAEEAYKESTRYGGAQLRPVEHRPGPGPAPRLLRPDARQLPARRDAPDADGRRRLRRDRHRADRRPRLCPPLHRRGGRRDAPRHHHRRAAAGPRRTLGQSDAGGRARHHRLVRAAA